MVNKDIKHIQSIELNILKEFQRICKKNNLRYFAIGGTCIGAIRHKGFIPWDDDIDVAMPSDDYFKFIEISENELGKGFEIMNPVKVQHSAEQYIKLFDADTTYIEDFAIRYKDRYIGIFIDIFPIFGLPSGKRKINRLIKRNDIYNKLNYLLRFPVKSDIGLKSRLVAGCVKKLCKDDYAKILKKQMSVLKSIQYNCSDRVLFCWRFIPGTKGSGSYKNIFYYEDFKEGIEVGFENITICVPKGYDRYLKMDFGNYMQLPPPDQQVSGHIVGLLDFENSYKKYQQ